MLDGQASTIRALLRTFPPGTDHSELALVRAMSDLILGHLDEATAYLAVAESHAETAPPDRQRRLGVAIAALKVALARRRGHLAGVLDQVKFLASPLSGESDEDIGLGADLRAVALLNLGSRRSVVAGQAGRRRTPPARRRRPGPGDRPALPRSRLPRPAGLRVEDPPVRHDPATLPRGDRAGRATRLGRGMGHRARADHTGRDDGVDGRVRRGRAAGCTGPRRPCKQTPGRTSGCCCTTQPRSCTPAGAATRRRSRSSARPTASSRNWRARTRWPAR